MVVNGAKRAAAEKSWATRVFERRDSLKLTQTQVADLAGITQQSLSRIERDEVIPRFSTMDALARALGTTVEQLFPIARLKPIIRVNSKSHATPHKIGAELGRGADS